MTVVMKRKGEDARIGDTHIKLPTNVTVLSLIGTNTVQDGFIFNDDWWVYKNENGKLVKVKKWFSQIEGIIVWPPILEDIKKLEQRYQNIKAKRDNFIKTRWEPIYNKLMENEKAHVFPKYVENNKDKEWWLYSIRHVGDNHYIGFDWVEGPQKPINVELGTEYYEVERKLSRYNKYVHMFSTVLHKAIDRFLRKNAPTKTNQILKLVINGRNYWYRSVLYQTNYLEWHKICWSDEEIQLSL